MSTSSGAFNPPITYHQKWSRCGKARCRKCREGPGHGPYWYAHEQVNGKVVQRYIGPHLPPGISLPGQMQVGRIHTHPLIGRAAEQQVLRALLDALQYPASPRQQALLPFALRQGILITGEAGIGKTRLAEEVGREAQERGWCVLWSRSYAQEQQGVPYLLWRDIVHKASGSRWMSKAQIRHQVRVFPALQVFLPEFSDALESIPLEQETFRLREAVLELLVTMSKQVPLLIVLDDVQWADESSCDLFAYLARRLHAHSIALIATCRDNELSARHPLAKLLADLRREQAIVTLPLHPLTGEQIGTLVGPLPHPVVQQIRHQAAGNPLFAEELARSLSTPNPLALRKEQQGHTQTDETMGMPVSQPLPETIAAVLDLRIERLSVPCQSLLRTAAIFGGSFEFAILTRLEASGSNPTSEDTVLDLLEEAIQAGVVSEEGTGTHIIYHFWHPLFASQLYDQLSAARRASLHRRAALVLQHTYRDREEEGAASILRHLVEGGGSSQDIIHYAERAGNHAYTLSAYAEAERFYRLCITQLIERENSSPLSPESASMMRERLAECFVIGAQYAQARHLYEDLLKQHAQGDGDYEVQKRALLWDQIGWTWRYEGDRVQARQCCEQGEVLLRNEGLTGSLAFACLRYQQGSILRQEGNYQEALHAAQEAFALFERLLAHRPLTSATTPGLALTRIERSLLGDPVDLGRVHVLLAAIFTALGRYAEATSHLQTALTIFEDHASLREMTTVACNLGDLYLRLAEYAQARTVLQRALTLAERIGDRPETIVACANMGILYTRSGDLVQAEQWCRRALMLAEQGNDPVYVSLCAASLAGPLQEMGNEAEARQVLLTALRVGRLTRFAPVQGVALVALAQTRLSQTCMMGLEAGTRLYPAADTQLSMRPPQDSRSIRHARSTLHHALAMEELEAETKLEALLLLAQAALLDADLSAAANLAQAVLERAQREEQPALAARAIRLLARIHDGRGDREQAARFFEQALQAFQHYGMRLEQARTLFFVGRALLLHRTGEEDARHGRDLLSEARTLFEHCHAQVDLQCVERLLALSAPPSQDIQKM